MTPRQVSKDQRRLKEKTEKEVLCDITPMDSSHLLLGEVEIYDTKTSQ